MKNIFEQDLPKNPANYAPLTVGGALILFGFPAISLWALGFLLGVDLISHGVAWLLYALQPVRRAA